jgi:hypothetical protein
LAPPIKLRLIQFFSIDYQYNSIRRIVLLFDPDAKLFLFGPGTQQAGLNFDLFIQSKIIDLNTWQ